MNLILRQLQRLSICGLVSLIAFSGSARSQSVAQSDFVPPTAQIALTHLEVGPDEMKIDGRLDERAWDGLSTIGQFAVVEPDTLKPEKYSTQLRIFYTEKGIYVGVDMVQPHDTLVSRLSARDLRNLNRDAVFITFDSSSEGKYGYWFGIALGGSLMDGTILPERRYAQDWDGPWRGATAVTEKGWSAEMFLPWSMMSMPHTTGKRSMGIYMSRKVAHLNERWGWPNIPETKPKFMSVLDRVQIENIAPKQQYSIFPYASLTADEVKDEVKFKAGADFFWRPSTDFQLTATLNPDFGTIEADDVIVNLTAIETFFPEKRLFFLEGKEVFVAAPRANPSTPTGTFPIPNSSGVPTTLLNTRRIGGRAFSPVIPTGTRVAAVELSQPPELLGALKVTGDTHGIRYGVLAAMEDDTEFEATNSFGAPVLLEEEGRDYAVVRVINENSVGGDYRGFGFMSTFASHPRRKSAVHGIDTHYLTPNGRWQWDNQLMMSDIDVVDAQSPDEGKGYGGFIDARYSVRRGRNHIVAFDYYDKTININDLGIFRRNDLIGTRYVYNIRTANISFGKDAYFQVTVPHEWNTDWQVVRSGVFTEGFVIRKDLTEWRFHLNAFPGRFEDRNSFGNGTYRIDKRAQALLGYSTDSSRRVAGLFDVRYEGEELGGRNFAEQVGVVWRPLDRLTSDIALYHRNRSGWLLHEGGTSKRMLTFDANEWNVKYGLDFFFNARHHFRMALQWVGIKAYERETFQIPAAAGDLLRTVKAPGELTDDFDISTVNFQLRYRWEMAPMSDLFLVYTKNGNRRTLPVDDFGTMFSDVYRNPVSEQLVLKVRYRFGS